MAGGKLTTTIVAGTLLVGCGERPVVDGPATPETSAPIAPAAKVPPSRLWRDAPTNEHFARGTLYTWTSAEQIEALRKTKIVLSRDESPDRGASHFEQVVHALAARSAIAKLLDTTTYARQRYAWVQPWATRLGWPGEDYGDELIRVVLKADAIILRLVESTGAIIAHDLTDREVPEADVLAHPERIAAVYFVSNNHYREYVLCNESMIARWSVGTADIRAEVEAEADAHDALAASAMSLADHTAWEAARAFENVHYRFEKETLEHIAQLLRATNNSVAIEGGGNVAFAGPGKPRTLRVVPNRTTGTYLGTYERVLHRGTY